MKKISIILFVLINSCFFAQTPPNYINYQGVARNNAGSPITNLIGVEFRIHLASPTGSVVYSETNTTTPNTYGIFSLRIGENNQAGFALINWGAGDHYLEVLMDVTGNTNYQPVGTQQMVSVPYALYAKSAGNSTSYNAGSNITFAGPATSPTINSNPNLSLAGNILSISGSGSPVTLPSSSLTASSNVTVTSTGINSFNINVPNYVAGNNVTIAAPTSGNDYTINAAGSVTTASTPFSLTVNSPHTYATAVNAATINIVAPNLSVTGGGGVVTNNVLPNYAISIPTIVVTPTPGGLSFTQNASTSTVALAAGGPWTTTGSTHHLITGANNVGIGTTNSTAKLTVTTSIANDAILAQSQGANGILAMTASSGTTDAGVYGTNTGTGYGIRGESISTNTAVAGVLGVNTGNGNGVHGRTSSATAGVAGVKGTNASAGAGVYGENIYVTGSLGAHGVKGVTGNPGAQATGVTGINTNVGAGVYGENTSGLNTGSGHGVYGKTNANAVNAYGVYGESIGTGSGVYGRTTSSAINAAGVFGKNSGTIGSGVYGESSATAGNAAAVFGDNLGGTPGIVGQNTSSSGSPLAMGVRGITNSSNNTAVAVSGESTGAAIGVRASIPSLTVAGSSNVALLIENGHIRVNAFTGTSVGTYTFSGFTSGTAPFAPFITAGNDVRGMVSFYTPNGFTGVTTGAFIEQEIVFAKTYSSTPVVVISPMLDMQNFQYIVKSVSPSNFVIKVYRSNNAILPANAPTNTELKFSYIVIE